MYGSRTGTAGSEKNPSHDSADRLLRRLPANAASLREESFRFADRKNGVLVVGDSTPDKPYARKIGLVRRHWSGKHHRVVSGINLVSLPWTDGDAHIPCDSGIYYKSDDGSTKNDHSADMLSEAKTTGSEPECVLSDTWYASLKNLGTIDGYDWFWLTRSEPNRLINPDGMGNIPLSSADISESGSIVRLRGYGFVRIFGIVGKKGNTEYWATNNLSMDESERIRLSDFSWTIGEHHRGLRQFCGIERCQCRIAKARRNHIGLAIRDYPTNNLPDFCRANLQFARRDLENRATISGKLFFGNSLRTFLRFGIFSLKSGQSWSEAKTHIIRDAVRAYISVPVYAF